MSELRTEFERLHPVPDCAHWYGQVSLYGLKVPADVGTDTWVQCYSYNSLWQGFQSGHAAGLERAAEVCCERAEWWRCHTITPTRAAFLCADTIRAMKEPK